MSELKRTRRLRKYEADDNLGRPSHSNPTTELHSPFGPQIAKTTLPTAVIDRLNQSIDPHIDQNKSSEALLSAEAVFSGSPSLASLIEEQISHYVKEVEGSEVEHIEFEVFWVVSQYEDTPSPVHFHSGDISGVFYLKEPTKIDPQQYERNYISGRKAGFINFIEGNKQRFSKSLISFEPRVGDLYVFPGWLLHGAEPFIGEGERRSVAFNANIRIKPD
ncbi:putative 2OG-Fe(II) oxygenase [Neptuniibacter caesariensis]|uniref:Fe2OG dioxygenase domain-containing protein n=1 Tax=Neptuniibacter caesariensis TaxID=207954 RepID=A0A7U8C962_NEPCE|nr:putative 2OG-Fe(II) oxygenase [Neptuniibacter caesariensis]EAR62405.1 hypothetical protein MED92_15248 [Oceanospirillum sp. MED92] [Neptuniibacter caesariensis]